MTKYSSNTPNFTFCFPEAIHKIYKYLAETLFKNILLLKDLTEVSTDQETTSYSKSACDCGDSLIIHGFFCL